MKSWWYGRLAVLVFVGTSWIAAVGAESRNLLPDGSFEAVRQERLSECWSVETEEVADGKQSLRFTSDEAASGWVPSGYVQSFPVNDQHTYAVTVSAKTGAFRGPGPPGYNAYMVLNYYDKAGKHIRIGSAGGHTWNRGGGAIWIPHLNYVTPPKGAVEARLEPMAWKCTGTVLIDAISICDVGMAPEPRQLKVGDKILQRVPTTETSRKPRFSAAQRKQGFVVFVRDEPGFIFPNSHPGPDEITSELSASAARGQYCAMGFALYPLKPLRDVRFELGGLRGRVVGEKIAQERCDLRRVRCWPQRVSIQGGDRFAVIPEILEPMERDDSGRLTRFRPLPTVYDLDSMKWKRVDECVLPAEEPQLLWLSLRVPSDARPGKYRGSIRVRADGCPPCDVRVSLDVLRLKLERPKAPFQGFYLYDHRYDDYGDEQLQAEFREMQAFGVESPVLLLENHPRTGQTEGYHLVAEQVDGRKRITGMRSRRLERILDAYNKCGMRGPIIVGYHPLINREVAKVLGLPKEEGADMAEWSHEVRRGMVDSFHATSEIMAKFGQEKNWALALKDEPKADYARHITQEAELARQAGILTFVTCGSLHLPDSVVEHLDILCNPRVYDGGANARRLEWCGKHDVTYWYYEGGAYTSQDGKVFPNRFFSGFQLIKSGAQCHVGYTFQSGLEDPWNEFASRWGISFNTTYPLNPDVGWTEGPFLSTLQWEGMKEGFADLCYFTTLTRRIEQAEKHGGANLAVAAKKARGLQRAALDEVPWGIITHYGYPAGPLSPAEVPDLGFHNGRANTLRKKLADGIARIEALLGG